MPAITISSVNTTTDTLTATAHGLLTGDRCRVRNVGGTLPTGLTGAVDAFAVRLDANNVQLADTNAHALAGTNIINITAAGSGTNTLEYGLPYCIPGIAAAGSQVKSADFNGMWTALVALYDLLTAQAQTLFPDIVLAGAITANGTSAFNAGITGPLMYRGTIGAAVAAGNNNNFNPTNFATAIILRLSTSGGSPVITGIAAGGQGRIVHMINTGADTIAFTNQDAASSAGNRLQTPTGATTNLATNQSMSWLYDGTSGFWRLLAKNF